jgi:hypothetical protein
MATVCFGVFLVDGRWKVFRNTSRTGLYDSREEALSEARREARKTRDVGVEVELYVEQPDGELTVVELGVDA